MAAARRSGRNTSAGKVALAVLALVVVVGVVAGIVGWSLFLRPSTDVEPGRPVNVVIAKGATTAEIARQLAADGVVANATLFRLAARDAGADGKLRAGSYELATGMPDDLVIEKMLAGPAVPSVVVTIPEGFTIAKIAKRLEKEAGIPAEEFRKLAESGAPKYSAEHPYLKGAYRDSLEGYLFPKTYRIKEGTDASGAIEMMLDQFDKEIASVDTAAAEKRGISLPELVAMASVIERETRVAKERPLVSSVIYNRLDDGMRLQMCSTIEYVLNKNALRLTDADLKTDSPYNTYIHKGLPPGPIASPGLDALKAAAKPADTRYVYYVLTGEDGSHTFATNNADFLAAKRKSKEVFGQ